jgi:glycosyl transferase family 1
MRLIFVHWVYEDRGSAQDLYNYREAAQQLGHEVVIYGAPELSSFRYSLEIGAADGIIFIVEWTTALQRGDQRDWLRLAARVPRARRVVIDCDGKYNDAISVVGDHNHPHAASSRAWIEICDSLSDKIYQPTRHPLRSNVGTFYFHAYNPAWAVPLDFSEKSFGMIYVGNNWFRWGQLQRILRMVERVRPEVGRIGIIGQGWDKSPAWANSSISEDAYHSDPEHLKRLGVEVTAAVRFDQVIASMGGGVFTPVLYRPLFEHLRLVTCRTFETPAANTIPVFGLDPEFVEETYGGRARALALPEDRPEELIRDVVRHPHHYAAIVEEMRRELAERHSYAVRLQELVRIVEE